MTAVSTHEVRVKPLQKYTFSRLTSHPTEGLLDAEGEPAAPRGLVENLPNLVQFPTTRAAPANGGGGGGGGLGGGGGGLRTPAAHSKQRSTTRSAHGLD